jgi:hypothetical protein
MSSFGLFEADVEAKVKDDLIQVQYDPTKASLCILAKFKHPQSDMYRLRLHFFFSQEESTNQSNQNSRTHQSVATNFIGDGNRHHVDFSEALLTKSKMCFNKNFDKLAIKIGKTLFGKDGIT